jgi:amidohydrolase
MEKKELLKKRVNEEIDRHRSKIEEIGDRILAHPELGFKEFETAKTVAQAMSEFGLTYESGLGITGVKGILKGKKPGPTVALLGELDALVVGDHPEADPETHAAHACGHNAQIAGLLGAMMGLIGAKATEALSGNIVFFAVPAEEYVEVEYRSKLVEEGKISYLGGKPELIKLGHFDDVDMAVMIHTHSQPEDKRVLFCASSNGCLVKMMKFIGRGAHAGAAPHRGINALNAAQLALSAVHAQRETFKDEDTVRIHPIITKGGELVNVVPSDVRLETFVRAKTLEAIVDANAKLDRSLRAGAMAVGAKVEIRTLPGYLPMTENYELEQVFRSNSYSLYGEDQCLDIGHQTGSTLHRPD